MRPQATVSALLAYLSLALLIHAFLFTAIITVCESIISTTTMTSRAVWTKRCPCVKCDTDDMGRKRVICDEGGRDHIPSRHMDTNTQVIIFTAPPDRPNQVIIGRIFLEFAALEAIVITHSNVPAIGDSSFWPGRRVGSLDLSFNNITLLRDMDFNGLTNLITLNLSNNKLAGSPSAPFRFLTNLTHLNLSRNKLTRLVPRLFFRLEKLEFLDLSGNPLEEIESDYFKDLKSLRKLYLAKCQLTRLHSLIYQSLPILEELDLRDNQFENIASAEFQHLSRLKDLYLDGNRLTVIAANTFNSHHLHALSLSRNSIESLATCSFCNSTVKHLDISSNQFNSFQDNILEPLSNSLLTLNAANNSHLNDPSLSVVNLIEPLKVLRVVSLSSMNLDDKLPSSLFTKQRDSLTSVNLSDNNFENISSKLFEGLNRLEELDLSRNKMYGLSESVLEIFDSLRSLTLLNLDQNQWSCFQCHIAPLLEWLRKSPSAYVNACEKNDKCVTCASPEDFKGRLLHTMDSWDLEWCANPAIQLRISTSEPNVGLVLALLIIISLIIVIIAVIILYRKQGATYYTHEDELRFDDKTVFSVSNAVQQFADVTSSPPVSPDSPSSLISSATSSPSTQSKATSPHSTQTQSSLPGSTPPPSSPPCQSSSHSSTSASPQ